MSWSPPPPDLYASAEQYRTLLEWMNEGVMIVNPAGVIQFVNDAYCELLGFGREELVGLDELALAATPQDEAILMAKKDLRRQGICDRYEIRLRHQSGDWRWVLVSGTPLHDDHGRPVGSMGIVTDITERKRSEVALCQREQYLSAMVAFQQRLLMPGTPDPAWILEPLGLASGASRVYVFENHQDSQGQLCTSQRWEWCAAGIPSELANPALQSLPYSAVPHLESSLARGVIYGGRVADLPPGERELIEAQGIVSILILPMTVGEDWLGFIGFDACEFPRTWTELEVDLLKAAAATLALNWERRRIETVLRQTEAKYRSIFENAVEGIFQTTPAGRYLSANPALARIYGYPTPADLMADLTDIRQQLYVDARRRDDFVQLLQQHDVVTGFESQVYRRDGTVIWISENARAVRDEQGQLLYYEGTVEDISRRKQAEDQLVHNAFYDTLTGLPNRALFMKRLRQVLGRSHPDRCFGVLFIDLDRFKVINDSLGHVIGDQLLVELSRRLERCVRLGDTVARLGGDEFAILLEAIRGEVDALQVAERIQAELGTPFWLHGHEVCTSASIGVTLPAGPDLQPEDVLRDADTAMYQAKVRGKAQHILFDQRMQVESRNRLRLEMDLRRAVERQELRVQYQPIVALADGKVTGLEALVRWQHPERGLVSPVEFIPLAEETGLIVLIGQWVLQTAAQQMQYWRAHGYVGPGVTLHVNLSGRQFAQLDLVDQVIQTLAEVGLPTAALRLEITEGVIMENWEVAQAKLTQLRQLGIWLCLDDFGTGYSSLSRLHQFPIDTLKIDRSFVMRLETEAEEIVQTILTLAQHLSMSVVAEGIETLGQCVKLQTLGCIYGQGYLFARPLDPEQVPALCRASRVGVSAWANLLGQGLYGA